MILPPINPETASGAPTTPEQTIDEIIQFHPLTISLLQNPNYTLTRPHADLPPSQRSINLMAGPLSGPSKITTPPYIFTNFTENKLTMILHLGSKVCGHPGIIHGGLLATLFDEGLARCCFASLPNKIGVTANLNVDYRAPALAEGVFVLTAEVERAEGRKVWGRGWMKRIVVGDEDAESTLVAEATALFIEPRDITGLRSIYKAA
ncbi:thioesterase family protein [Aspergillus karnatakaensis]|uniref:PaaI family thioesterase n=1 Tax=Aspergillus karnatakaensis TaxID=1810916 RepID=UPI003CCCCD5C